MADVNVLVSVARSPNGLCGRLLGAAIDGRRRPVVSVMLVQELEDVLARPRFRDVLGPGSVRCRPPFELNARRRRQSIRLRARHRVRASDAAGH
ncbi:MAG: PIN domain-containing protein [Solirubrobacteraceae bacterium]